MICQGDSVIRDNFTLHMPQIFLSLHLIFHKISCQFRSVNSIYNYLIQYQNCAKTSWSLSFRYRPRYFALDLLLIQAGGRLLFHTNQNTSINHRFLLENTNFFSDDLDLLQPVSLVDWPLEGGSYLTIHNEINAQALEPGQEGCVDLPLKTHIKSSPISCRFQTT